MTWSGPLDECAPHLMAVLRQLLDCPEVFRPFVIVQQVLANKNFLGPTEGGVFVQFAGSTERGLLFDVPAFGVVALQVPTVEDAVNDALTAMREQGVPAGAVVRVTFESTRGDVPGRMPAKA